MHQIRVLDSLATMHDAMYYPCIIGRHMRAHSSSLQQNRRLTYACIWSPRRSCQDQIRGWAQSVLTERCVVIDHHASYLNTAFINYLLPRLVTNKFGLLIELDSPGWRPVVLAFWDHIRKDGMDTPREHSPSTPLSLRCIPLVLPTVQVMLPLISMATDAWNIYMLVFCMHQAN